MLFYLHSAVEVNKKLSFMYSTTFGLGLLVRLKKYLHYMYCVGVTVVLLANISLIAPILSDRRLTLHVTLHLCQL